MKTQNLEADKEELEAYIRDMVGMMAKMAGDVHLARLEAALLGINGLRPQVKPSDPFFENPSFAPYADRCGPKG